MEGGIIRLTGKTAEKEIHSFILDESVDRAVLQYLLPDNLPHAWEGSLWDYKRELPSTSGRGDENDKSDAKFEIAELVKDVLAFHNSYGGYIIAGIDQYEAHPVVGCDNLSPTGFTIEKLNEQIFAYTKGKISCKFNIFDVEPNNRQVAIILVPMRSNATPVVRMLKGAPEKKNGTSAFKKGDVFARIDDASVPVHSSVQGLQFVCSTRRFSSADIACELENNLPPQDPNLIKFVGRSEYILQLWTWLTDRHTPVKILTALGGTGKTSIAYEFCRQVVLSPPSSLQKAIWLTAKKKSFSAIQGRYVNTTRTDFESVDTFFYALIEQLGYNSLDLLGVTDRDELLDLIIDGMKTFPSLVVIDDVDSLDLDKQADLFSTMQIISGRCFDSGSRFLFTSRLELSAGESQKIKVQGFEKNEFKEFSKLTAENRGIILTDAVIDRLHKASLGSPIFCTSILRLVSLGSDINSAINQWKNSAGEDVREFAFARELKELTDSEARTLYALSVLGDTTQLELKQVLNLQDGKLTEDLSRLREFHLFASAGDPGTGATLSVPEPIRLMKDILRERVNDPSRIEKECGRVRNNAPKGTDKAASAIHAIMALWREENFDGALLTAMNAQQLSPKHPDLQCMVGRCYLKIDPANAKEADKTFRKAYENGCKRPELLPNWLESKKLSRDQNGIVELSQMVMPNDVNGRSAVIVIEAMIELVRQRERRGDTSRALNEYKEAMQYADRIIKEGRALGQVAEIKELCREAARGYVKLSQLSKIREADKIDVFNAVFDAFQCYVAEPWMISLALESIILWSSDALSRLKKDDGVIRILRLKISDLDHMSRNISLPAEAENSMRKFMNSTKVNLIDKLRQMDTQIS